VKRLKNEKDGPIKHRSPKPKKKEFKKNFSKEKGSKTKTRNK